VTKLRPQDVGPLLKREALKAKFVDDGSLELFQEKCPELSVAFANRLMYLESRIVELKLGYLDAIVALEQKEPTSFIVKSGRALVSYRKED